MSIIGIKKIVSFPIFFETHLLWGIPWKVGVGARSGSEPVTTIVWISRYRQNHTLAYELINIEILNSRFRYNASRFSMEFSEFRRSSCTHDQQSLEANWEAGAANTQGTSRYIADIYQSPVRGLLAECFADRFANCKAGKTRPNRTMRNLIEWVPTEARLCLWANKTIIGRWMALLSGAVAPGETRVLTQIAELTN